MPSDVKPFFVQKKEAAAAWRGRLRKFLGDEGNGKSAQRLLMKTKKRVGEPAR
jgi:hypothetical protein